ncbi:hypothetical protein [Corallococcus coralloides]|nr:hypothetical protein [Corallococcus coralloides]
MGDTLISSNGNYRLLLQHDGNLVVSRIADNGLIWANYKLGATVVVVQGDTNFVAYDDRTSPATVIWHTGTGVSPFTGATLRLHDDGALRLYNGLGTQVWSTPVDPQTVPVTPPPAPTGGWSCSGASIPSGWVLTSYLASGCAGAGSWYQEPARDGIWTCAGSPIVAGYVVTGHNRTGCSGLGSWYHQLVKDGLYVCPESPVPSGYFISGNDLTGCSGLGAWRISKISTTPGWYCAGAPIPDGYVLTGFMSTGCNGAGAWYQQPAKDGLWTCSGSPTPYGYVSTNWMRTGCNGVGAWYHQLMRAGLWVCPYTNIPSGYSLTTYDATRCGGIGGWFSVKN